MNSNDSEFEKFKESSEFSSIESNNTSNSSFNAFDTLTKQGNIDLGSIAPVFGVVGGGTNYDNAADYLDYNIKGRTYSESLFFNTGTSYLSGIMGGGIYGFIEGAKNAPSPKFKIRLNSILNSCGKRGSRAGNSFGILAMYYSSFESAADHFELDRLVGGLDQIVPIVASTATGLLYKCTAGPRAMVLAGILGGSAMAAIQLSSTTLNLRF